MGCTSSTPVVENAPSTPKAPPKPEVQAPAATKPSPTVPKPSPVNVTDSVATNVDGKKEQGKGYFILIVTSHNA